jgi:hypothetical protein
MNQPEIIIKTVPQSTPFALPSRIIKPPVSDSVRMIIAGWPRGVRGMAAGRSRDGRGAYV